MTPNTTLGDTHVYSALIASVLTIVDSVLNISRFDNYFVFILRWVLVGLIFLGIFVKVYWPTLMLYYAYKDNKVSMEQKRGRLQLDGGIRPNPDRWSLPLIETEKEPIILS